MEDISIEFLSRNNAVLDSVLNGITDGVYIADLNRRILYWNLGAELTTGYPQEEVIGLKCNDEVLTHFDESGRAVCIPDCPVLKVLTTGTPVSIKTHLLHKNGRRILVSAQISPVKNQFGDIIAAIEVFRDISREQDFYILQDKFNSLIRKYVSSATVEKVMSQVLSGTENKSLRRDLSILYLDVVNFTSMAEKHSPEKIAGLLNEVFGICELITREFYGDIDKFIGDAVMAVFIDAQDAVSAGENILQALCGWNEQRRMEGKEEVNVRIAINSGNVIQAEIGTSGRKDLTVIGEVVNTAAHIEKLVSQNSVFITEATLLRLKGTEKFRFDKRILLKGKTEPVSLYSLISVPKLEKYVPG